MNIRYYFLAASLLWSEAFALFGPEFKTSSPGFHRSRLWETTGYKLPGTARPIRYDLTLFVSLADLTYSMQGEVYITLDVDDTDGNGTYALQLNSNVVFDNVYDYSFVWNDDFSCTLNILGDEFIEIGCPEPINGTNQRLKIAYDVRLATTNMDGAYVVSYNEAGIDKVMAATQFEQGYARSVMPCFDEPEYKAPIQLTLKTDIGYYDVSDWIANTKVASTYADGTTVSTTFESTPNMSTYLLAFVVTQDFKNFTNNNLKADYDFSIFARPAAENYLSFALENGPKAIDLMGEFTGIPYVTLGNDKMTLAAIPEFQAGAMENWGLITFREQIIIDEGPERTTRKDLQYIIEVIAHEVTHQWFGDYVTMDWWSDTWLNEGFAEYFEYYLTDQIANDFQMMQQLVIKEQQPALKTDAYPDTIPLANDASNVTTGDDFTKEFGDVSYSKGACVIKMIRHTMGDEAFQKGLQKYLTENQYGNPTSKVLIDTLQTALPDKSTLDLPTLFKAWFYEPGYPILDVSLDSKNSVTIKSTKFSSSFNKSDENSTANWWIPLTYTTSASPNFIAIDFQWVDPAEIKSFTVSIPDNSWIIFNLQAAGFYRVNYDETLWNRIINVLNNSETFSTIDVINRAQLLDDAFNIAKSYDKQTDLINSYQRAFRVAEYLKYETEYYPWYTFFTEMQYLMEKIQDQDALIALKETILDIVAPQLVIPQASDNASHTEVLKTNLLLSWACRVGHQQCIEWAQEQFEIYKVDTTSIDNNYREVIVCTGLANTNQSKADYVNIFNLLKDSILPFEGKDLAKSLTCFNKELWINQTLEATVGYTDPPFSRMFYDEILKELINGGAAKASSALKFLLDYDYLVSQYWHSIENPETALKKTAAKIFSEDDVHRIERYIQQYEQDTDRAAMIVAANEALEIINNNFEWLDKYGDVLTSVLVYGGGPIPTTITTEPPETTTSGVQKNSCNVFLFLIFLFLMKCLFEKI